MSGRDLRKFVNFHRNAIGASDGSLVSGAIEGRHSNRYRPADYDKLKAIAQLKEASSKHTLHKIEKITQASKNKKEHNLLQQHRACWSKEHIRLKSQQRRLESEIDALRPGSPFDHCAIKEFFHELEVFESILDDGMKDFKQNTVEPLWDLREDVQFWLSENRERLILGEVDKEHADVVNVIESVKAQQRSVLQRLLFEKEQLEAELEILDVQQILAESTGTETKVAKGIPEEAAELDCPDEHLKERVLQEFNLLDKKYEAHLEFLDLKYNNVLHCNTGGWSREDHFHFVHLLEQYPADLPNRRTLYIDRMMREITHATRSQLVEHEEWLLGYRFYQNQRSSTLRAWAGDKEDLLVKVKATFADTWVAYEEALEKDHTRKKQEQICKHLYEKVLAFREQRLEALKLKAAIAAKKQEEQEELLRKEEEKEMKRRDKTHKQIDEYHLLQQRDQEATALAEKKRLEELQKQMAEQAILDRERVRYREEKLRDQQQARLEAEKQAQEAERERDRRLDKLREQVQPHVESDPERVFKPTEAFQSRAGAMYDEELELQQPLFNIYGFTETQVRSDARLKVEFALRDAGLHHTDYARRILAKVKPPNQPRKDQQSTVFKFD